MRPLEAELSVPEGVEIIGGKRWQELGQLEGRSNKIWNWWGSASPTDNRCKLEWVVRAQRAGTLRKEIVLNAG